MILSSSEELHNKGESVTLLTEITDTHFSEVMPSIESNDVPDDSVLW